MMSPTVSASSFEPHCDQCPLRRTGPVGIDGRWIACNCTYYPVCRTCEWPITDNATHALICAIYAREQLTRGCPPHDWEELSALLVSLGLHREVPIEFLYRLGTELDDNWAGYHIEWALIPDVTWRQPYHPAVVSHPFRILLPEWDAPKVILRWRQWRPDSDVPVFLEHFWRRRGVEWEFNWTVRGSLNHTPSQYCVAEFARLLADPRGRRRDDPARFLADLQTAFAAIDAEGGKPNQAAVASRLHYTLPWLQQKFSQLNRQRRADGLQPISWRRLAAER